MNYSYTYKGQAAYTQTTDLRLVVSLSRLKPDFKAFAWRHKPTSIRMLYPTMTGWN